ncbi:MAG: glycosyltransferase [Candidatus Pacebacteria bacterium]|nr:glycosyltransferase [Candidatus Paceibacterota bacterium]
MPTNVKSPTISIITPSYNQASFLPQTIESVVQQDYPRVEYIVMDGGSTDGSVNILRSYGKRVLWESTRDKGQADAINKGIERSHGDIIGYLNSDDYYLPGTLQKVAAFFADNPKAMWVTGDYFIVNGRGKRIHEYVRWYKKMLRKVPTFFTLGIANSIAQPSTFWRRGAMREIGIFDVSLHYCMDYDFWLRLIQKYPLYVMPEALSVFRIHQQSKGRSQFVNQFEEEVMVLKRYTTNPILLELHKLHAKFIVRAYLIIK